LSVAKLLCPEYVSTPKGKQFLVIVQMTTGYSKLHVIGRRLRKPNDHMGGGRIFYVGAKPRACGGKGKSILLNIKRVRKLKY